MFSIDNFEIKGLHEVRELNRLMVQVAESNLVHTIKTKGLRDITYPVAAYVAAVATVGIAYLVAAAAYPAA